MQEQLLSYTPGIPFLLQQVWMSCAAMSLSLITLRCVCLGARALKKSCSLLKLRYRLPFSALVEGFDWRVLVLLFTYVASGLTTGLMVKKLGAVAKSLCVPIYLGGCYFYAVHTGSATFTLQVVMAWCSSTACILLYAMSKLKAPPKTLWQRGVALPPAPKVPEV